MICFALLAHKDEKALQQQIRNIRKYNPKDAMIVFYNGGPDHNFGKDICKKEKVMYCPLSRPLVQRKSGRFFYDVMKWLEEAKVKYEYLVYMEYDIMFINPGFKSLLEKQMKDHDVMVKMIEQENSPREASWAPAKAMWKDWDQWKLLFQQNHFHRTSSPMSVYRYSLIRRMLAKTDKSRLERLLRSSNIHCLGEMLYITLAMKNGARCCTYPRLNKEYLRFRPELTLKEVKAAKSKSHVMFVHPVKDASVQKWIAQQ